MNNAKSEINGLPRNENKTERGSTNKTTASKQINKRNNKKYHRSN